MVDKRQVQNAISQTGKALFQTLVIIIIYLNFTSGIIGGIWLVILGQWKLIIGGILAGILMPFAYTIVNLPAMGIGFLSAYFAERNYRVLSLLFGFITSLYTNLLMVIWVLWAFNFVMDLRNQHSPFPFLLWGYAVMIGPLSYMASHEDPDSVGTTMVLFLAQLTYFIFVGYYFWGSRLLYWIIGAAILALSFSIYSVVMASIEMRYCIKPESPSIEGY